MDCVPTRKMLGSNSSLRCRHGEFAIHSDCWLLFLSTPFYVYCLNPPSLLYPYQFPQQHPMESLPMLPLSRLHHIPRSCYKLRTAPFSFLCAPASSPVPASIHKALSVGLLMDARAAWKEQVLLPFKIQWSYIYLYMVLMYVERVGGCVLKTALRCSLP